MKYLLFAFITIVGCAPLNQHATPLEKVGEVIGRTVLCPLTLCMSEVGFAQNYKDEQNQMTYERWRQSLTAEERVQEDRRIAERDRSLAIMLSGRPLFRHVSPPTPQQPRGAISCATNPIGDSLYTTCY